MKNYQINQMLESFDEARAKWIEILNKNPGNSHAAITIITINAKMEVYRAMWNWHDESVEMSVIR